MLNLSADDVVNRLKEVLGASSDLELAENLGMHPHSAYNWRRRKSIPWATIAENCDFNSFMYVVFGLKPKSTQDYETPVAESVKEQGELYSTLESPNLEIEDVLSRLYRIVGSDVQSRVAEHLRVHRAVLSGWKTRGKIPWQELHKKLSPADFFYAIYGKKLPTGRQGEPATVNNSNTTNEAQSVNLEFEKLKMELHKTQGMLEQCQRTNEQLVAELSKPTGTFVTPRERVTR